MNDELNDSFVITKKFRSSSEFSLYIEQKVVKERIGYMDAIISYCEHNGIDVESIGKLITHSLKEKIQIEAEDSNLMRPRGRLPL